MTTTFRDTFPIEKLVCRALGVTDTNVDVADVIRYLFFEENWGVDRNLLAELSEIAKHPESELYGAVATTIAICDVQNYAAGALCRRRLRELLQIPPGN